MDHNLPKISSSVNSIVTFFSRHAAYAAVANKDASTRLNKVDRCIFSFNKETEGRDLSTLRRGPMIKRPIHRRKASGSCGGEPLPAGNDSTHLPSISLGCCYLRLLTNWKFQRRVDIPNSYCTTCSDEDCLDSK